MIIDGILTIVFGLIDFLLTPLGAIHFNFDISSITYVLQYFKMALYIIPFAQLSPILVFFIAMMGFRIVVSMIKTIWDLLPIL